MIKNIGFIGCRCHGQVHDPQSDEKGFQVTVYSRTK